VFPVLGKGFLRIRASEEKPSGTFSAKDLRCNNLVTSVLVREVGGSGFIVNVSSAAKLRGGWVDGLGKVGKQVSVNLQFAKQAFNKAPLLILMYLIIDAESKPT
jgi:hypothetical protein